MLTEGIFGGISSVCLGTADFMGRFSSRAVDHHNALLGMLLAGITPLSVWMALSLGMPPLDGLIFPWVLANGVMTTVMTLLLYLGLSRGPISVVAPIVSAHPVLVILYYALTDALHPGVLQWAAMFVTIAGTLLAARGAESVASPGEAKSLTTTVLIALGASAALSVVIITGQQASQMYGEVHTLWLGRIISIVFLLMLFGMRRRTPAIPVRWWPFLCAQGLLDAGGYIALFAGSAGDDRTIVTVVAATFGAVTILLARFILKETISLAQWIGIGLVFLGVMVLSG